MTCQVVLRSAQKGLPQRLRLQPKVLHVIFAFEA